MIWDQLTSAQIDQVDRSTPVVLILAATEQHGPHLPLATDRLIGEFFARKLHDMMPEKVLVLPAIAVGCSDHHMKYSGTLSLTHDHFAGQVSDIIRSVIQHRFKKILLLNSHGGNQGIGQVVTEKLGCQFPEVHFVLASWWQIAVPELQEITETGMGGVGHGGEFETSLMMLIAPDLVVEEKIPQKSNIPTFKWAEGDMLRAPEAIYYRPFHKMTTTGIFGNPTTASADQGKRIADCVLTALNKIILDLSSL